MNSSLVSIIVPCYNHAHFLPETLQCVLEQTYLNWECIIINDGSTDHSEEVAEKWIEKDSRFKYFYKENGGLADARNFGIKCSNGKYILPLDSDDLIAPTYIEKAVSVLEKHTEIGIVYCKALLFEGQNGIWHIPKYKFKRHLTHNTIFCTALFRRKDFDKTIGYNKNLIFGYEDWDFWLSLIEIGIRVFRIPEYLFSYRIRSQSMRNSINWDQLIFLNNQIIQNHFDLYKKNFKNPHIIIDYLEFRRNLPKNLAKIPIYLLKNLSPNVFMFILRFRIGVLFNLKKKVFLH
jgi:glycosyltransferase involved in cell wall biosynthesis